MRTERFVNSNGHAVSICQPSSGLVHVWIDDGNRYYHGTAGYDFSKRCRLVISFGEFYSTDDMMRERIKNFVDTATNPAFIG